MQTTDRLRSDNRWLRLAKMTPWDQIEARYATMFRSPTGPPALIARIAVGSLVIKEKLQLSDEETAQQIRVNPYLQYFLGYRAFSDERPFDSSMLVHFRRRVSGQVLSEINDLILAGRADTEPDDGGGSPDAGISNDPPQHTEDHTGGENDGTLLMDATCVPASIRYPTDLLLLDDAREMTEKIIDVCHAPGVGNTEKPRTYRRNARRKELAENVYYGIARDPHSGSPGAICISTLAWRKAVSSSPVGALSVTSTSISAMLPNHAKAT